MLATDGGAAEKRPADCIDGAFDLHSNGGQVPDATPQGPAKVSNHMIRAG